MAKRLSNQEARDLVYSRVNKGLCPICNRTIKDFQEADYEGVKIRLCKQHVLSIGITPLGVSLQP